MASLPISSTAPYYYINKPIVMMREAANLNSEVVSQAYFSEEVSVLEKVDNWVKIETLVDCYQGWVKDTSYCVRDIKYLSEPTAEVAKVIRCTAHLYHLQGTTYGPMLTVPFDSKLEVLDKTNDRWIKVLLPDGRQSYIQKGDVSIEAAIISKDQMCSLSLQFLALPYTWGGRCGFGYDCSGFVQMLYRQMGLYLPRDSKDQILWQGFRGVAKDEPLLAGDLIFFGVCESKITHVGLCLGNDEFIHATVAENLPFIRISSLKDEMWNGSGPMSFVSGRRLLI